METAEEIIKGLSLKYNGDWQKIYDDIALKSTVEPSYIVAALNSTIKSATFLDQHYPERMRRIGTKPPFVIYFDGDENLLEIGEDENTLKVTVIGNEHMCKMTNKDMALVIKIVMDICKANPKAVFVEPIDEGTGKIALRTAIKYGAKVIGVKANGIHYDDNIYDCDLIRQSGGLIITESPEDFNGGSLLTASRMIGGITNKIIIVGANTVEDKTTVALTSTMVYDTNDANMDILAVPDRYGTKNSLSNALLRFGANIYTGTDDLEDIEQKIPKAPARQSKTK